MADERGVRVQQPLGFWKHVVEQQLRHVELVMTELGKLEKKQLERAIVAVDEAAGCYWGGAKCSG